MVNIISRVIEKSSKAWQYLKLEVMFATKSEFAKEHPELILLWKRKFRQMVRYSSNRTFPIVKEFLSAKIERKTGIKWELKNTNEPILVCALKNDVTKMWYFMKHYRDLGIKYFVFLDNMSTDGTYEFLLEQADTIVYRCENAFTADRKIAWLNRLMAEFGINKWYFMVDSDEFFSYLGSEKYQIKEFIERLNLLGLKRVGHVYLDMYPREELFKTDRDADFMSNYCYFDKDTYIFSKAYNGIRITGGPRKRVFGTNMKISGVRLVYFEEDDIVPSAHFMIPYFKGEKLPVYLVSRHYKFVNESDYFKMIEAVKTGMHSNNSEEYKTYFEVLSQNPDISLYDEEHSLKYSEENIRKISFLEDIFEENE